MNSYQIRRVLRTFCTYRPTDMLLNVAIALCATAGIINTPPAPPPDIPFAPLISPTLVFWVLIALLSMTLVTIFRLIAHAIHSVTIWDKTSPDDKRALIKHLLCDLDDKGKARHLGMTLSEFHAELNSLGLPANIPATTNPLLEEYGAAASTSKQQVLLARLFAGGCTLVGAIAVMLNPREIMSWLGFGLGVVSLIAATIVLRKLK